MKFKERKKEMEYVLTTENVTKVYGKNKVVNRVNMHMKKGSIYGFIGKNVPRYEQETGSLFRHLQLWRELYT